MTSALEVVVYRTRWCGYCRRAAALLNHKHIAFREIDVGGDHETRAWLREATGQRTVPQIFIGDRSIGGYQELSSLDRSGELDALVAARPVT